VVSDSKGGRLSPPPIGIINSAAPIRICDNGGWTDTWFAGRGQVLNVAVDPCVEVQIAAYPRREGDAAIRIHPENFGEPYEVRHKQAPWGPHPLLEAAIASVNMPSDRRLEVSIHSSAPPGAGTGTSAAVTVALIGALHGLERANLSPHEAATAAHRVETEMLGRQSGIQDQLAAAYGGINFIDMPAYPRASVSPVRVSDPIWWEFERRLLLIYLGRSHDSSAIHQAVIRKLEDAGPDSTAILELRETATRSRNALVAADFEGFGQAMIANTEAQERLHSDLIGAEARDVIEIARSHGIVGFKVNGAGGDGGSLTLLCDGNSPRKRSLVDAIQAASGAYRNIPIRLNREGLRVWRSQ
jgi:D-glycero-alpha-D-manno-heptose-7-phosphate kinase